MLTTEFSKRSLRSMIRREDGNQGVLKETHLREKYLSWLEHSITTNNFQFGKFKPLKVGSFQAYEPTLLGDKLVLRIINKIIRHRYSTRQADRNTIIQQAKILLEENCPKYIYKVDIAKFYESIDRGFILKKLFDDNLISSTTHNLISILFANFSKYTKFGLPRGLALSSTLSELYLKDLDKKIAEMDGVYYYSRYVDDMIIFSSKQLPDILLKIAKLLPSKMNLNIQKCLSYYVGCNCHASCECSKLPCKCAARCTCSPNPKIEINYLGYKLSSPRTSLREPKKKIPIDVSMADNKIKRIKARIVMAFLDHHREYDFSLLHARIKFLTENRKIKTLGRRGKLMSGVHYNYPLVTDITTFVEINKFLRSQVYANRNSFGIKQSRTLSSSQKDILAKLSFVSGFKSKRLSSISSHSLKKIRKCW
ncbi:MAG: antiviral reverse transcriptase Drt3a [Pseudomonadota bacterium]